MRFFKRLGRSIKRAAQKVMRVPVLGTVLKSAYHAVAAPIVITSQLAQGKRVDRVLMGQLKTMSRDAKDVAPLAQTIVSFVPGVGSGISAALGAGLAIAEGQPIDKIAEAAVAGAVPGGPVAVAVYHVASNGIKAAATGKKFDFADAAKEGLSGAVQALGLPPAASQVLVAGVDAAGKVAHGEPLDKALTAGAISALPLPAAAQSALHEAADLSIALAHGQPVDRALLDRVHGVVGLLPIDAEVKEQIQGAAKAGRSLVAGQPLGKTIGAALHSAVADTLLGHAMQGQPAHVANALKAGIATGAAVVHQANLRPLAPVVRLGEGRLKGSIGARFQALLANPMIQTPGRPVAVPPHLAYVGMTGGLRALKEAAKADLGHVEGRASVRALGSIFAHGAPAALALGAAHKVLNAAERGAPDEMVKAATQIAAAHAGADAGDAHAKQVVAVLSKAAAQRKAERGLKFANLHELNASWLGSTRANAVLEAPSDHAAMQPSLVQQAVNVLDTAGTKPHAQVAPPQLEKAKEIVARALAMGVAHPHVPFFVDLGAATHGLLSGVEHASSGKAQALIADLENRIMAHTKQRTAELNALVIGYNAKHPDAVARVTTLRTQHEHGDHSATAYLDDMRRRTSALKKAQEYTVDVKGYVRHGGAGHPAAHPAKPPARAAHH